MKLYKIHCQSYTPLHPASMGRDAIDNFNTISSHTIDWQRPHSVVGSGFIAPVLNFLDAGLPLGSTVERPPPPPALITSLKEIAGRLRSLTLGLERALGFDLYFVDPFMPAGVVWVFNVVIARNGIWGNYFNPRSKLTSCSPVSSSSKYTETPGSLWDFPDFCCHSRPLSYLLRRAFTLLMFAHSFPSLFQVLFL